VASSVFPSSTAFSASPNFSSYSSTALIEVSTALAYS
jgi:hypothetical protein